ncbi:MAG: tautomerase family protein [Bacilli bacterium]
MPIIKLKSSNGFTEEKMKTGARLITNLVESETKIPGDKIIIDIKKEKANIARCGVFTWEKEYSSRSRKESINHSDSYYKGSRNEEEFLLIEIFIWNTLDNNTKHAFLKKLAIYIKKEFNLKKDNVLISVLDTSPSNWYNYSISGNDENFLMTSRELL